MSTSPWFLAACAVGALGLTACFETADKSSDTAGGGDGGDGGDGGSGDGGDGGSGSGSGSGGDIDCDADFNTPSPDSSCVTDTLSCGDSVVFNMQGAGSSRLDAGDYSSGAWACWPADIGTYEGGERFFQFDHPATSGSAADATITLDSPCADLDLFAFFWESDSCPSGSASPYECEAAVGSGGGSVYIWNNEPRSYLIAVEGRTGAEGPFRLSIDCNSR